MCHLTARLSPHTTGLGPLKERTKLAQTVPVYETEQCLAGVEESYHTICEGTRDPGGLNGCRASLHNQCIRYGHFATTSAAKVQR